MYTWQPFGNIVGGTPVPTAGIEVFTLGRNSDGSLEAFAVSWDNTLCHIRQTSPNSSSWSGWSLLSNPGFRGTDLVVGQNADGRLEVFMIGTDKAIWHAWQSASGP